MLDGVEDGRHADQHAADRDERALRPGAFRRHRTGGESPAAGAERQLAQHDHPAVAVAGLGQRPREVKHRDEQEHHDAEQQPGPLHTNSRSDTQRRGHQRDADEIHPEHPPRHVGRHETRDAGIAREVFRTEHRQRHGEEHVAQRDELVETASLGDGASRAHSADREKGDEGGPHRSDHARNLYEKDGRDKGLLFGLGYDAKNFPLSPWRRLPNLTASAGERISQDQDRSPPKGRPTSTDPPSSSGRRSSASS